MGSKYILVGRILDSTALEAFVGALRVTSAESRVIAKQVVREEELSLQLGVAIEVQCPVGPHDYDAVGRVLANRCGNGSAKSVAIQCLQGHWAEYPCLGAVNE